MAFRTLRISEIDPIDVAGVHWLPVRHTLGVQAFGVNAYRGDAGEQVIEEHTEEGSDHEEMYVVLHGRARFTLDGEDVDAPAGTAVFLPDPPTLRVAMAEEDGTVVLARRREAGRGLRDLDVGVALPRGAARARRATTRRPRRSCATASPRIPATATSSTSSPASTPSPGGPSGPSSSSRRRSPPRRGPADWAAEDEDLASLRERPDWPL